jgi:hypothetical protein
MSKPALPPVAEVHRLAPMFARRCRRSRKQKRKQKCQGQHFVYAFFHFIPPGCFPSRYQALAVK